MKTVLSTHRMFLKDFANIIIKQAFPYLQHAATHVENKRNKVII